MIAADRATKATFTEAELEEVIGRMWASGGRPEYVRIRHEDGIWEEFRKADSLRRVCTPGGLKALFPALKVRRLTAPSH